MLVKSVSDALALVLSRHVGTKEELPSVENLSMETVMDKYALAGECPDCSSSTIHMEGCIRCTSPSCGWSKC